MIQFDCLRELETVKVNYEDKDYFLIERFKKYTEILYNLSTDNEMQTLGLIKEVLEVLRCINRGQIDLKKLDIEFQEYFDKEYIHNVAKYLIINRTFKNQVVLQYSNSVLIECMDYFIKNMDQQKTKLVDMLRYLMDYQRAYFKINNQDQTNSALPTVYSQQQEIDKHWEFIHSLSKDDLVDCVKTDISYRKSIWSRAKIKQIKDDVINVQFLGENQCFDKWIDSKQILEIQQYKSKSDDYEWREELQEGMEVDGLDTENLWYNSTILQTRVVNNNLEVQVGYRLYCENGDKVDQVNNKSYFGWSQKYDEWLGVHSPRIQKLNSQAKTTEARIYQMQSNEEIVDDSNDHLIDDHHIVILRSQCTNQKGLFLQYLATMFYNCNGFEKIIEQLNCKELSLEIMTMYVQIIGNISVLFNRPFATQYIKRVIESVNKYIYNSSESNIRQLNKEKLEQMFNSLGDLMKRLYPVGIKNILIEEYQLQISLLCFKSEILEKQLQGLKQICEILRNAKQYMNNNNNKKMTTQKQQQWLNDNNIFELLFNINQHDLLIKKSGDLIKFMVQENIINENHLDKIWNCSQKGSTELRLSVFKLLNEVSVYLKAEQQFYFLEKVRTSNVEQLSVNEIDLIHEMTPFYQQNQEYCSKATQILFDILQHQPKYELIGHIINRLGDLLKNWEMKVYRMNFLQQCMENIKNGKQITVNIKTVLRIFENYPVLATNLEDSSKNMVLNELQDKYGLFELVMNQFRQFKQDIKDNVQNLNSKSIDQYLVDDDSYICQVKLRFKLFEFIIQNQSQSKQILGLEQLELLWDVIYNDSLVLEEKLQLYGLFNKLIYNNNMKGNDGDSGVNNSNIDKLQTFFTNYMCKQSDYDYQGFQILKQVFYILNQQRNNIQKLQSISSSYYGVNIGSGTKSSSYSNSQQQLQYRSKVMPSQMIQMDFIWHICLDSQNVEVNNEAMQMITCLYLNQIDEDLKQEYINEFLELAFKQVSNIGDNQSLRNKNVINLIQQFLDESETNGIGNLKAHCNLNKGQQLQVVINNNANQGLNMQNRIKQKIFSNQTLYELKQEIAKQLQLTADQLELYRNNGEQLYDRLNGRLISELKIKNQEALIANKRNTNEIEKAILVDSNGQLNKKLKQIFISWFSQYSTDGKMSMDQCASFINSCTGDNCKGSENRVKVLYDEWDKDNDGYLVQQEFIDFYYKSSQEKPSVVWANLYTYHYRNDLKLPSEVQSIQINEQQLPRYQISQNKQYIQRLFDLLNDQAINIQVWELISRLPSSPQLLISSEEEVDWEKLLDPSNQYILMYNLYTIEYLNIKQNYNFIQQEGLKQLFKLLNQSDNLNNQIFLLVLDIISSCLLVFLDNLNQNVVKYSQQIQIDVSLEQIDQIIIPANIYQLQQQQQQEQQQQYQFNFLNMKSRNNSIDNNSNNQDLNSSGNNSLLALYDCDAQYQQQIQIDKQQSAQKEQHQQQFQRVELDQQKVKSIVKDMDLEKFQQLLVEQLRTIIEKAVENEIEIEERTIIQIILSQLVGLASYEQSLLKEQLKLIDVLVNGLFSKDNVRKYIQNYIYLIQMINYYQYNEEQSLADKIQTLFEKFPKDSQHVAEYFDLLCKLIQQSSNTRQLNSNIQEIIDKLINYENNEKKNKQDKVLVGKLRLLEQLIISCSFNSNIQAKYDNEQLIQEIFSNCLFNVDRPVKCTSKESRERGYRLLQVLCQYQKSNIVYLLGQLEGLVENVPVIQQYNYKGGQYQQRSQYGYCGIRNLGCICYMNAMLQQFYMTKSFRYGILMADDFKEPVITTVVQKDKPQREVNDNMFHQLQKMYTYLDLSDRIDYNPIDFCYSFKDFQGEPVNVTIQQDAQEFLNMIFDKLEKSLEKTAYKKILEGIYGGKTYTIIQCKTCHKKTLREEDFYNISLPIKNKNHIMQSFDKFIEGEEISDYNCEGCNKKSDIIKRSCLSQLPNFLICHLQRIVFDMETMMNEKINTRLEFPHEINLYNYTYAGLEEKEKEYDEVDFEYKLKGVVVHIGQAEFGHYYSYINTEDDQWLEFNDSNIINFDSSKIDAECFGGTNSYNSNNDWGWMKGNMDNSKNAYILVYEKIKKKSITILKTENQQEMEQVQQLFDVEVKEDTIQVELDQFKQFIPKNLYQQVYQDNQQFMLEEHLYSEKFFKFVNNIIQQIKIPNMTAEILQNQYSNQILDDETQNKYRLVISVLYKLIYRFLCKTHDNDLIVEYSSKIKHLLFLVPQLSYQFFCKMAENSSTFELIFNCPDKQVRQCISNILLHTINICISYFDLDLSSDEKEGQKTVMQQQITVFLENLLDLMPNQLSKQWSKMGQYFEFWRDFSFSGEQQVRFMMERKFIQVSLDFYLGQASPFYSKSKHSKRQNMGSRYQLPNFNALIKTIANLVLRCQYDNSNEEGDDLIQVNQQTLLQNVQHYVLDKNDIKCLFSLEFYEKSLRESQNVQALGQIVQHLGYENERYCFIVSYSILKGIQSASTEDSKQYLSLVCDLLDIDDKQIFKKCEWLLGFPQLKARDNYGCYNMINLDDLLYTYQSTLNIENTESIIDMMLYNRKRVEFQSILVIQYLVKLALKNNNVYEYLLYLPPCNYLNNMFHDWMADFVQNYIQEQSKYYINDQTKIQIAQETVQYLKEFKQKINNSVQQQNEYFQNLGQQDDEQHREMSKYMLEKDDDEKVLKCLIPQFIVGKSIEDVVVRQDYFENKQFELNYNNITSYVMKSRPTGVTNLSFKDNAVKDHYIFNTCVHNSDIESLFIKPRNFSSDQDHDRKQYEADRSKTSYNNDGSYIDYAVQNVLKKYVFSNNSQQYILIQLSIKPKEGEDKLYNTKQMFSKMTFLVGPNSRGVIFNLYKLFPNMEWDDFETNFNYVLMGKVKPNEFKAYLSIMSQGQLQYDSDDNNSGKQEQNNYNQDYQDVSYVVENGSDYNNNDSIDLLILNAG